MRKTVFALLAVTAVLTVFLLPVSATEMPDEYGDFTGVIPEDVAELLPEGFFSGDAGEVGQAVNRMSSPDYLLNLALRLLSGGLGSALGLFVTLVSLVALSALLENLRRDISGRGLSDAIGMAVSAALAVAVVGLQYERLEAVSAFFERLRTIMVALLPLMGALYMSGGNTAAAAVNNSTILLWLDLVNVIATGLLVPTVSVCTALAIADSFRGSAPSLGGISGMIKRTLVFMLGLAGTILAAALGSQSVLASASDNMSARAIRYVAGNMIPVFGSTVGDTLRTVAASTKLLRGTVGIAGITVIAVMLLPVLIALLLTRLAFTAAAAVSELLGCSRETQLLREMASLYGYVIAAATMAAVLFILALTVFAVTSAAVGGSI